MAISFFVAREKLSEQHQPVGQFWVRVRTEKQEDAGEHPGDAATKSHDRMMPGEVFLNAIPTNPPKVKNP